MREIHGPDSGNGVRSVIGAGEPTATPSTTVIKGACPHDCPDTCALDVHVRDGIAVKVAGSAEHAPTAGVLCTKVARYTERTYHPDRLLHPMRRIGQKGRRALRKNQLGRGARRRGESSRGGCGAKSRADPALQLRGDHGIGAGRIDGHAILPQVGRQPLGPHHLLLGGDRRTRDHSRQPHRRRYRAGRRGQADHLLGLERHYLERAFLGAGTAGQAPRRDPGRHRSLPLAHRGKMPYPYRPAARNGFGACARAHACADSRRSHRSRLRAAPYLGI